MCRSERERETHMYLPNPKIHNPYLQLYICICMHGRKQEVQCGNSLSVCVCVSCVNPYTTNKGIVVTVETSLNRPASKQTSMCGTTTPNVSEIAKHRTLIIGSTGFIGRFVAEASLHSGHPTYLLVRPGSVVGSSKSTTTIGYLQEKGAMVITVHLSLYIEILIYVKVHAIIDIDCINNIWTCPQMRLTTT